jgi:RNA polymerase sigma-70 factor (ECF subfamily)
MDEIDLHQAIIEVLQGDLSLFEKIMRSYQQIIFTYCYHMLGHHAEAEDATQDTFIKAYHRLGSYQPDKSFEAWLYKIASNTCIDVLRKRKLSKYLPFLYKSDEHHRPVDQAIEEHYWDEAIAKSMSKLSPEERSLLILRCVEDKDYREIGEILQQNSNSLRKKFQRTASKFRKHYAHATGGKIDEGHTSTRPQKNIS